MIQRVMLICIAILSASFVFSDVDSSYLSYSLGSDQISVVYVMSEGVSDQLAKEKAFQKGSEIICSKGYGYFSVVSESKVTVIQAPARPREEEGNGGQFSKSLEKQNAPPVTPSVGESPTTSSGYKMIFQGYSEKPKDSFFHSCG